MKYHVQMVTPAGEIGEEGDISAPSPLAAARSMLSEEVVKGGGPGAILRAKVYYQTGSGRTLSRFYAPEPGPTAGGRAPQLEPVESTVRNRALESALVMHSLKVTKMSKTDAEQNRPGSRTNTPQHLVGEYGGKDKMRHVKREGIPTGEGTEAHNDVGDPHPAEEERPYEAQRPGGAEGGHSTRLRSTSSEQ
jgi:hypothetical protein